MFFWKNTTAIISYHTIIHILNIAESIIYSECLVNFSIYFIYLLFIIFLLLIIYYVCSILRHIKCNTSFFYLFNFI